MRFVIQVVSEASVRIDGKVVGDIGRGLMVLVGVSEEDDRTIADKMIKKLTGLRIFPDGNGKTNLSVTDVGGSLLIVSQFTLYADMRRGNRPNFLKAGNPQKANMLYEYIVSSVRNMGIETQTGEFGADMSVSLVNEGPFTVILDSDDLK